MVYSFTIKCLEQGVFMFGDERSTLIGVPTVLSKKSNSTIVSWKNCLILFVDEMSQGHEIN